MTDVACTFCRNWGVSQAGNGEVTGTIEAVWETLEVRNGNNVNFGAVFELDNAVANTVNPTRVAVNGQDCVLF